MDTTFNTDDAVVAPAKGEKTEKSSTASALVKQDEENIHDFLSSLPTDYTYKFELHRKSPKVWKNKPVGGHLATVDETLDLDQIKTQWGGGTFVVMAKRPKENGKGYTYAGQRTVEIAGEPRMPESDVQSGPAIIAPPPESEALAKRAMDMTEKAVEQERRRAEKLQEQLQAKLTESPRQAFDPMLLDALTVPLREQLRVLADQNNRLQEQLQAQANAPRTDGTSNRLLEKFLEGDSSRLMQMREVHDTEIRTLKESAREDVRRAEDRMQRLIDTAERTHEREVQGLKSSYEQQLKMQEIAFTTQVKNMENMLTFSREEIVQLKAKIVELEAKKDKNILDSMKEMAEVRELMEAFGGGEAEEEPVWKQALGALSESPVGQAIATKLAGGGAPAGQAGGAMPPGAPPTPNPGQPGQRVHQRPGRVGMQPRLVPPAPGMVPVQVNQADVAIAVKFLEGAVANNTSPEVFVQSARSSVPAGILTAIKVMGIDAFMAQFAAPSLDDNSNLMTMHGRNFLRKVARLLVGEPLEEAAPAPAALVPAELPPDESEAE